jgi:hypothetical protein
MAINNLGSFLSPYFTKISSAVMGDDKVASRYLLVSILAFVAALFTFVLLHPNKKKQLLK